jgi:subtilisin family serine protease
MADQNRRTFLKTTGAMLGGIAAGSTVTAAERTDRFIVNTADSGSLSGLDVVHELDGVGYAVVSGSESDVKASSGVKSYAPDVEVQLDDPEPNTEAPDIEDTSVADEPFAPIQWDKQALDVSTAHETTKGDGARVAIIDTGVAGSHPDLEVNETLSANFTGDGLGAANPAGGYHGTHVAGIATAQTDNEQGVAGTAPEADLVDCRVFSPSALASFGDILAAVAYSAAIGADVANLSLGAYPIPRQANGSFYGKLLNRIMTYANSQGTLLVVAAGNDAADLQHDKNFVSLPNEGAQALSVSATGPVGFLWDADEEEPAHAPAKYTNYGTNAVDIGAPGGNYDPTAIGSGAPWFYDLVFNTISTPVYERDAAGNITGLKDVVNSYSWLAGTSMAAPNVAGAAALVKSANPTFNPGQVKSALTGAADVPENYGREFYGSGFLNILDAL